MKIHEEWADKYYLKDKYDGRMNILNNYLLNELSTDDVTVLSAFLGDTPESIMPGFLIGYAKLKNPVYVEKAKIETKYIKFIFCVKNEHFATNNMQSIELQYPINIDDLKDADKNSLFSLLDIQTETETQPFGVKGFWLHTPTNTLSGEDLICRNLINQVQKISRKYDLKNLIIKNFKQNSEINIEEQER